jgi:hypothetical protein
VRTALRSYQGSGGQLGAAQPSEQTDEKHFVRIALDRADVQGKRLLDANCMKCHQTDIFTSKDRKIQSLDALKEQLVACSHAAKKEFSANEMQDLLKYLNDQFYHFQ